MSHTKVYLPVAVGLFASALLVAPGARAQTQDELVPEWAPPAEASPGSVDGLPPYPEFPEPLEEPQPDDATLAQSEYAWLPGHWSWTGEHYEWVEGSWVYDLEGFDLVLPFWEWDGEKWVFHGAGWVVPESDEIVYRPTPVEEEQGPGLVEVYTEPAPPTYWYASTTWVAPLVLYPAWHPYYAYHYTRRHPAYLSFTPLWHSPRYRFYRHPTQPRFHSGYVPPSRRAPHRRPPAYRPPPRHAPGVSRPAPRPAPRPGVSRPAPRPAPRAGVARPAPRAGVARPAPRAGASRAAPRPAARPGSVARPASRSSYGVAPAPRRAPVPSARPAPGGGRTTGVSRSAPAPSRSVAPPRSNVRAPSSGRPAPSVSRSAPPPSRGAARSSSGSSFRGGSSGSSYRGGSSGSSYRGGSSGSSFRGGGGGGGRPAPRGR